MQMISQKTIENIKKVKKTANHEEIKTEVNPIKKNLRQLDFPKKLQTLARHIREL